MTGIDFQLPCFKCGNAMDAVMDGEIQPYAGTVFTGRGNYGSTVFDPAPYSRRYLMINVCDECMRTGSKACTVVAAVPHVCQHDQQYERWDPDDDD